MKQFYLFFLGCALSACAFIHASDKHNCECKECACTAESHCGCFSDNGCHCDGYKGCCGENGACESPLAPKQPLLKKMRRSTNGEAK